MSNPMLLLDLIDFRSFSNLWYWIVLCVIWSSASYWVLGVPHDMVTRARREGGEALDWLETMARINASRLLHQSREYGPWLVGMACFIVTTLGVLAIFYDNELSLALGLIILPLMVLIYLTLGAALRVEAGEAQGEALFALMFRTRLKIQGLGMVSIFVTALVGMYVNLMHFIPH